MRLITTTEMEQELINDIRHILEFMEQFDTLVEEAKRTGDTTWENDLYAGECSARNKLRELVDRLLGDVQGENATPAGDDPPF